MKRRIRNALLALAAVVAAFVGLVLWESRRPPDYTVANGRSLRENVAGRWDWTTRERHCVDSAHTIAFRTDSTMTITSEYRIVDDSTGADFTVATYDIVSETGSRIQGAIRGETRRTSAGTPVVWELIVTGPDSYAWGRTDWPSRARTATIRRCRANALAQDIQRPDAPMDEDAGEEAESYIMEIALEDFYRGFLVNNQLLEVEVPIELSVFSRTDTSITGYLRIGEPLDLAGLAYVGDASGDSMYLIVETQIDTLVLASATRSGSIGGDYWVTEGRNPGQGGSWELSPAPRASNATLAVLSATAAIAVLFPLLVVAFGRADRWWAWRLRRQVPLTDEETTRLARIRGWLVFFVLSLGIGLAARAVAIHGLPEVFAESWMLGDPISLLRPLLVVEGAFDFLYFLGAIVGLVLLFRRSAATPLYFTMFFGALAVYAIGDIASASVIRGHFAQVFGAEAAVSFDQETAEALGKNRQLVLWSMVWLMYWTRAKRVAAVFGSKGPSTAPPQTPAVSTSYTLPHPDQAGVVQ